ncbi:MAG TPA: hypothetical protein VFR38_12505 [Gaiellaceae bacterium]|nr:hypothetical protein [Gaiellaceae bacterium]
MFRLTVAAPALTAAGALVLALGGSAAAAPVDLGRHVAMCAQGHLGQREAPPAVMCTHDGMTMTFPTFGAMVQHMSEMHG